MRKKDSFINLCAATVIVAMMIMTTGCYTPKRRSVKRPAWDIEFSGVVKVSDETGKLLEVSADGTKWEWYAKPEDVVEAIIEFSVKREAKHLKDVQAILELKQAAK